jgi:dimethylhistidine N-methyltransferase
MNYPERLQHLSPATMHPVPLPARAAVFRQLYREDAAAIRAEVLAGLLQPQAAVPPKFFYDAMGSRLFEAITELPEYYPTRVEASIFADNMHSIVAALGTRTTLIDLGAGNCEKAAKLFDGLAPTQYVAVDISVEFLRRAVERLQQRFPATEMLGVGMDFSSDLHLPLDVRTEHRTFFYPGSSIGNFHPSAAQKLLQQIAGQAGSGGALLIGIDLVKPERVLVPAYDDALGVTAAFNLNMLLHLNRLVDTDFSVQDWQHAALFNAQESRVEMHLRARRAVTVRWSDGERAFAAGETIHTECSYKYTLDSMRQLLQSGGFTVSQVWTDPQQQFAVILAHVS